MIIVLMGVSGSGKTTIGNQLSTALGWDFVDGDTLHPQANIDKMSQGIALTDDDRQPWLETIRALIQHEIENNKNLVLACSALKASYRAMLRQRSDQVKIVYLKTSEAVLQERMERRHGHFMPPILLQSQLDTLEEPTEDAAESDTAIIVNVDQPPEQVAKQIRLKIGIQDG
jgi:gluconokinase